jgi:methionine synthase II (cobalamin-independent)
MNGELMESRIEKFDLNSVSDLFNPVTNAEIAFYMTKGGKDWSSWTYLNGERIKEFLAKYPTV